MIEAIEDSIEVVGRDAWTVIAHRQLDFVAARRDFDLDLAADAEPDRVGDEVRRDLHESRSIPAAW